MLNERGAENWLSVDEIRSEGKTERTQMRDVMRLVLAKVMLENDIDVLVNPENSLPPAKLGGPSEPTVNNRGMSGFSPSPLLGIPSIVVPAGFNQILYEPQFVLSEDKMDYDSVTGTEQTLLDAPGLPIGMMFWAGPGEEPTLLKVASAYEAATHHRAPPPGLCLHEPL